MKTSTGQDERLERELLEALRGHKRRLIEHFGHEDKIPESLGQSIGWAQEIALARFQSTAQALRRAQQLEAANLPGSLYNVDRDHPIFKKGKGGKGPFEVRVVKHPKGGRR